MPLEGHERPSVALLTTQVPMSTISATLGRVPQFLLDLPDFSIIASELEERVLRVLNRVPDGTRTLYQEALQDLNALSIEGAGDAQVGKI